MDYSRMRAAALRDGEDEEAVTVDTRALIDKVLARYSGEWTTLRELIQNAADAQATTVTVKWETLPSTQVPMPNTTDRSDLLKHTISNHTLRRLVVQNDGQPFTKTDWGRLKRIAEGNPDETKIGAFGVGFYSVFADCEEPFVSSGSEAMAFYWKGNALFTKKSQIPQDQASHHTTFVLDNRNTTTPIPNLLSIAQFLATSLTFVALQNIEFWIDDYQILSLQKKTSPSVALPLPRDLETRTKDGLMNVVDVARTSTQIDATFINAVGWKPQASASRPRPSDESGSTETGSLRSFFAKFTSSANPSSLKSKAQNEERTAQTALSEDLTKKTTSTIFLGSTTANIQTSVTASFASELERATKKPPPKTTKISILTSSYDEAQASAASAAGEAISKATDVFASVLPSKKPGGRIFIGFPTMQTTGAGLHISAPSTIPTVEREAIDLNARWVRTWNVELLRASGIVSRLAFANEMDELNGRIRRQAVDKHGKLTPEIARKFIPEAEHILKTYFFRDSTPNSQVGQAIEEAFWTCFKRASIEVYSTRGVLLTSQVRLESAELSKFIDGIPVLPKELNGDPFVKKLIDFGLISHITVTDITKELELKSLDKDQLLHFISWAGKKSLGGELDPPSRNALLQVAVGSVGEDKDQGEIIALGVIKNYLVPSQIPANLPIPPSTIPLAFTVNSQAAELRALGWEPLEPVPWLTFLLKTESSRADEQRLTRSPKFAAQVLMVLSRNWDNMSSTSRQTIASLLRDQTVMPTKLGMRKPGDSFFPSVKLFDDLPVIEGCDKLKEKFLVAIGVRKTVDLDTIFTRLLNPPEGSQQKWSHVELIKYLASVQNDIPRADMEKLRNSRICPAEAGPKGMESTNGTDRLYKVSELFEPKDSLRALKLPIIQWPGPPGSFRPSSPEARFLTVLGLRVHPTVPELVTMMASKDESMRTLAMTYFIGNYHVNRYEAFDLSASRKAFVPLQGSTELVVPSSCFTNERASVLGFQILRRDLRDHASKFGVARDPPMAECVNVLLANPPQTHEAAVPVFSYFATRIQEIAGGSLNKLRDAPIVPVTRSSTSKRNSGSRAAPVSLISPSRAYLGSSLTYGDIFDFVDFGQDANAFLFTCGAKSEPTKLEVAQMACSEPARLLSVLQSPEKYIDLLKSLAESSATLQRDRDLWRRMKSAPFLLAYKELASPNKDNLIDLDEDEAPVRQYQLAAASRVVVVDDIIAYRLFKEHLVCAPEEDALEAFYMSLGARKLSDIVEEDVRIGPHSDKHNRAAALRKHVLERSKIFLYEYTSYRRDAIKHDTKWLEKNLRVEMVSSVALRRTLKGQRQSHAEKRSAASSRASGSWVLYVANEGKPDMYQVGQALCQMLLDRPNQQAYLFFEPFLTLDLYALRARGYNVDRILRAKAAEARIAEEERRRALEEEQKQIQEREKAWAQQGKALDRVSDVSKTPEKSSVMPGAWDTPEESKTDSTDYVERGKSFFSDFTRRFGLDSHRDNNSQRQLEESGTQLGSSTAGGNTNNGKRPESDSGRVTSPAVVQQNLLNAVNATRPHGSSNLFTNPEVNEVKEQATYCDSRPATNIQVAAHASNGMKVYLSKDLSIEPSQFLSQHSGAINAFASILAEIAQVYTLSRETLHIFYDETGGTIAFNTDGSLFCNFRYFLQLHANQSKGPRPGAAMAEAAVWWWVVLAHELAHNLVSVHNSDHSYYTESFIQQYFPQMMDKAMQWMQEPVPQQQQQQQQDALPRASTSASNAEPPPPPYSTGAFS